MVSVPGESKEGAAVVLRFDVVNRPRLRLRLRLRYTFSG
jgi:hypothetical protein